MNTEVKGKLMFFRAPLGMFPRVFVFHAAGTVRHDNIRAQGSRTFEKPELHAASHALLYESGHIVVLVDDTHFDREALSLH